MSSSHLMDCRLCAAEQSGHLSLCDRERSCQHGPGIRDAPLMTFTADLLKCHPEVVKNHP